MKPETARTKEVEQNLAVKAMLPIMADRPDNMEDPQWNACILRACGVTVRSAAVTIGVDPTTIQRWSEANRDIIKSIAVSKELFMRCTHTSNLVLASQLGSLLGQQLLATSPVNVTDFLQYVKALEAMHRLLVPDPVGELGDGTGLKRASRNDLARASRQLGKLQSMVNDG